MPRKFWMIHNTRLDEIWTGDGWQLWEVGKSVSTEGCVFNNLDDLRRVLNEYSLLKDPDVEVRQYGYYKDLDEE